MKTCFGKNWDGHSLKENKPKKLTLEHFKRWLKERLTEVVEMTDEEAEGWGM